MYRSQTDILATMQTELVLSEVQTNTVQQNLKN